MSQNNILAVAVRRLQHFDRTFWVVLLLSILGLTSLMSMQPQVGAQDTRVVTIYADDKEQTFPTDAETVDQALTRAGIELKEEDLVEPGLTSNITTDSFKINVYRARPVLVVDGDEQRQVLTPYQSPRLIAEDAGLTVYPEDEYDLERIDDFVGEATLGLRMTVDRATPIRLNMYGTVERVRTQAETVGEFVSNLELSTDEGEVVVRPAPDKPIKSGMTIHAVAVSDDTVAEEEPIPFERREIKDTSKPLGFEEVRTPGENGSKLVTYKVTYENGQEASRKAVNSVVVEQPVEEVVVVGTQYDLSDAFARLRQCESGGDYTAKSGDYNGDGAPDFYGAYQFMFSTWKTVAPAQWRNTLPSDAPASAQDQAARTLQQRSGWGQWPACARSLGLL